MTDIPRLHYVYVLFRPAGFGQGEGTPFYIGKGKGPRIFEHFGNHLTKDHTYKGRIIKKAKRLGLEIPFIKIRENLTDKEAIELEIAFIKAIGRRKDGGPLANATTGGEGLAGHKHSAKSRKKMSDNKLNFYISNPNRREEQSDKWNDPEFRTKTSAATKAALNRPETKAKHVKMLQKNNADPKVKAKLKIAMKKRFKDPNEHIKLSIAHKKRYKDPKARAVTGEASRRLWRDPKYRKKVIKAATEGLNRPEVRAKRSKAIRKAWADPKLRAEQSARVKARFMAGT